MNTRQISYMGKSITAIDLIREIEKEANRGCGCYYELYQAQANESVQEIGTQLSESDRLVFFEVAKERGHAYENFQSVDDAKREIWKDMI